MNRTTKLMKWISIYLCLLQCCFCACHILKEPKVHLSNAGDTMGNNNNPELKMYCLNATSKYLAHIWRTMTMHLDTNPDSYILYDDKTLEKIPEKHNENQKSWSFNLFDTKIQLKINSFEDICIGVYIEFFNESGYITNLTEICTNVWKLTMMIIIGIIIFWCAYILSRNSFYYICGIIFTITLSITFLIYNMARSLTLLRGKVMCLVFPALMSTLYLPQLWESTHLSVVQYGEWIMWCILVIPLISLCVICYRCASVIIKKIKQIIQWFLQLMRWVYRSNYFYAASCFSCCIILLFFFRKVFKRGKRYWQTGFPEKRKLLSEDQYYQEGRQNTRKSLKELQNYCSSPEFNHWKTVQRLKDPIRFAKFMEGEPHLSKYEIEEHKEKISKIKKKDEYTDDDDDNY